MRRETDPGLSGLLEFIAQSPTAHHAASNIAGTLRSAGFEELDEGLPFDLKPGKGYLVRRGGAVAAFRLGTRSTAEHGFRIAAAHTDSPSLKLKIDGERSSRGAVTIPVEVYGGAILSTWLDRDLGIAGVLAVREGRRIVPRLYSSGNPVAVIPNVAIHLNRTVNEGFEYNRQEHLPAIVALEQPGADTEGTATASENRKKGRRVVRYAAEQLSIDASNIVDADLYLFDSQPPSVTGVEGDLVSAGRIDNLAACHAILAALAACEPAAHTSVGLFFNNEEVGSRTREGAESALLATLLERIVLSAGGGREELHRSLVRSFLVSNDAAHAVHPSYADRHDPSYAPVLNGGPVIKYNGNFRYATTAETSARFEQLCHECSVPVQRFVNRSDMQSGSTIGPAASSLSEIAAVDVGVPILGMHSIRETAGVDDTPSMTQVLAHYFSREDAV